MKKLFTLTLVLICFCSGLTAADTTDVADESASIAAKYMDIGAGAAASGMANAYLGTAADSVAVFWNPAGLAGMQKKENEWNMYFSNNQWLMDMMVETISIGKSFKNIGVFGLGVNYFNSGSMDRYDEDNGLPVNLGTEFYSYALITSLTYANTMDRDIDFGITLKHIMDVIDGNMEQAVAFDFGFRYFFQPLNGLSFNLLAKNFGGMLSGFAIPREVSFGAAYAFNLDAWGFNVEYDAVGKLRNTAVHRIGIEVVTPYIAVLRAGWATDDMLADDGFRGFTFGAGIVVNKLYKVDVAYEPCGNLGNVIKMSFGADF
ncbi:MAG: PorV/PorQ family protein [Spirochaetia bacterium]|nr:PorV/PorQ family protein [Spirochaetia bacterium]